MTTYGLVVFDGVEELDFVGPWEVFTASSMLRDGADTAVTIAERPGPVRCSKGLRVLADHSFGDHSPLDVLLVPGGQGTRREVSNPILIDWIRRTDATWITSVCTGALLLHEAGHARGRSVATHHAFEDTLQARGDVTVVRDARYVVDGNLVTSQGSRPASTWHCGSSVVCTAGSTPGPSGSTSSTTPPRRTSRTNHWTSDRPRRDRAAPGQGHQGKCPSIEAAYRRMWSVSQEGRTTPSIRLSAAIYAEELGVRRTVRGRESGAPRPGGPSARVYCVASFTKCCDGDFLTRLRSTSITVTPR